MSTTRAAWAVRFRDHRVGPGPVPGAQTAQRADLYAALQAAAMRRGALMIVTDLRYVSGGFQAMAVRRSLPFSTRQDLWAAAVALGGGRVALARWVPAHRRAPDPPLLSAGDWAGNARADALATQALARSQPPDVLLAAALAAAHEGGCGHWGGRPGGPAGVGPRRHCHRAHQVSAEAAPGPVPAQAQAPCSGLPRSAWGRCSRQCRGTLGLRACTHCALG